MVNLNQLAAGIVEQAVQDYLAARVRLYRLENGRSTDVRKDQVIAKMNNTIYETTYFFNSEWYSTLCPGIPTETLFDELEKRFQERIKSRRFQSL